MAQQDQGIMALNAAGAGAGATPQEPQIDMKEFRRQAYPVVKDSVREVAPEGYGEMQALLSSELAAAGDLDPQGIEGLLEIVDYINDNPEEYAKVRAALISEGVIDEDDFPKEMDVEYFATLEVVLQEALAKAGAQSAEMVQGPVAMMPPQGFAKGGIAEAAQLVASRGRYGDTMLAHITPSEARLLKARGGSGTINPETGLPEFFKKFFKSVGKAITKPVKSIVKAVKPVVKKVLASPVGRIAVTVGLTMIGVPPPLASALVTKAAGGSWQDALKSAAVSYLAAPTGPIGSYVTKATPFLSGLNPAVATGIRSGLTATGASLLTGSNLKQAVTAGVTSGLMSGVQAARANSQAAAAANAQANPAPVDRIDPDTGMRIPQGTPAPATDIGSGSPLDPVSGTFSGADAASGAANTTLSPAEFAPVDGALLPPELQAGPPIQVASADPNAGLRAALEQNLTPSASPGSEGFLDSAQGPDVFGNTPAPAGGYNPEPVTGGGGGGGDAGGGDAGGGDTSFYQQAKNFFRDNLSPSGIRAAGELEAQEAGAKAVDDLLARAEAAGRPAPSEAIQTAAYNRAAEAASPGIISQYAPAVGTGLGIMALSGGFEPQPEPDPTPTQEALETPIEVPETLQTPMQNLPGVVYDEEGNIIGSKPWNPYGSEGTPAVSTPSALPPAAPYNPYSPPAASSDPAASSPYQGLGVLPPYNPNNTAQQPGLFTLAGNAPSPIVPTASVLEQVPGGEPPASVPSTPGGTPSPFTPTDPLPTAPGGAPAQGGTFEFQQPYTTPQPYMVQQPYQLDPRDPASLYYMQNPYGFRGTYGQRVTDTPRYYKNGGIAALAQGGYPRRIGQIAGPGTETSDDIPAMLSDGEFVMTARAVRGAGGGSRREGAKKMYSLMHQLEKNAARG
jgi:hypothetical protein